MTEPAVSSAVEPASFTVEPEPTEEEAAAIVAAFQLGLPAAVDGGPLRPPVSRWRFSGRWWSRPVPTRRARPGGR